MAFHMSEPLDLDALKRKYRRDCLMCADVESFRCKVCDGKGYQDTLPPDVATLIAEVERLRMETEAQRMALIGEKKAHDLMRKGMESQCERMDELKQKCRRLEADNARLRGTDAKMCDGYLDLTEENNELRADNARLRTLLDEGDRMGEGVEPLSGVENVVVKKYKSSRRTLCPTCKGSGRHMVTRSRGQEFSGFETYQIEEPCPTCSGRSCDAEEVTK